MDQRTVGVEEELLLVDPVTRGVAPQAEEVLQQATLRGEATDLDHELFRHQLETRTSPTTDLADLRAQMVRHRRAAAEAAERAGLVTVASGTIPTRGGDPVVTRDDRYLAMVDRYGEVARPGGTCGLHVHVRIASEEEGVLVIDRVVAWLPVLLAISANSPYYHGRDTGYASWRSQVWAQWPSAGPTERFGSLASYRDVSDRIIASGAARDRGMLYFDARLSVANPTVEVRIADVCTDPDDGVLVAALVRALVARSATSDDGPRWRAELLRAAQWRAARYGLTDRLLDPQTGELAPARDVTDRLVTRVRDQLEAYGDLALVRDGLDRVLAGGGATRQRAAYERTGDIRAVVDDLAVRTNACWRADLR